MIIGMFIRQKEKEMQIKIRELNQLIEQLKKRIQVLNEENEGMKRSTKLVQKEDDKEIDKYINENIQMETNPDSNRGTSKYMKYQSVQNRSSSQGIARVIRRTKEIEGNVIVSTTKISYKRRNQG